MTTKTTLKLIISISLCFLLVSVSYSNETTAGESEVEEIIEQSIEIANQLQDPSTLHAFVQNFLQTNWDRTSIPGISYTIILNDTSIQGAIGMADVATSTPMTSETTLRLGSVSKPVLSTIMLMAQQEGILNLNDTFSQYADKIGSYESQFTLEDLLLHRAGFNDILLNVHERDLSTDISIEQYLQDTNIKPSFEIDKIMSYSSYDYTLAGYSLQIASEMAWEAAADKLLFERLNMTHSTYYQPQDPEILNNMARGYDNSDGQLEVIPIDHTYLAPGVALVSSVHDMTNYLQMILNDGNFGNQTLLGERSLQELLHNVHRDAPLLRGATIGFPEFYHDNHTLLYHNGNGIGFANRISLLPDQKFGMFISSNSRAIAADGGASPAGDLFYQLEKEIVTNFLQPNRIKADRMDQIEIDLSIYEGIYLKGSTFLRNDLLKIEGILDQMPVRDNGDGSLQIGSNRFIAVGDHQFQHETYSTWFYAFVETDNGNIGYITGGGTGSYVKTSNLNSSKIVFASIGLLLLTALVLIGLLQRIKPELSLLSTLMVALVVTQFVVLIVSMLTLDVLTIFYSVPFALRFILYLTPILILGLIYTGFTMTQIQGVNLRTRYILLSTLSFLTMQYIIFVIKWNIHPFM